MECWSSCCSQTVVECCRQVNTCEVLFTCHYFKIIMSSHIDFDMEDGLPSYMKVMTLRKHPRIDQHVIEVVQTCLQLAAQFGRMQTRLWTLRGGDGEERVRGCLR